ncbi:hypothetical protein EDC39_10896 [Geothermobacter ehrlichii]|uniref:OmpA family protein n=1 Tax=Geothermobacter ehrlichii TaxID=213224 RepID=A0A5D3WLQ1_9BACT|nr:hypothetical protein [Geothermobacter ehrlichii]TYO98159.1 hypothetical protein EDC39_10896 [Geothermobacter ehrlichii]
MLRYVLPTALLILCLAACGPVVRGDLKTETVPRVDAATLKAGVINLPGAEVQAQQLPVIFYSEQRLFAEGAVLPRPEALNLLRALAARLQRFPSVRWQATVRATSPHGDDHAQVLAAARAEMLDRFLRRSGLADGVVEWKPEAGAGKVLELVPQLPSPASSSGVKE